MSIDQNIEIVKAFFAAIGSGDKQRVLALVAEDIEWIIQGETGRWLAHTAGMRDWRPRCEKRPKR
jgi:ketosteroid isomerase-like protein